MKTTIAQKVCPWIVLALTLSSRINLSAAEPAAQAELTELPIETLMQIEVTSVSRKAEKISEAPAAISVITQDDIRRSGVTSIPEALRLAPGLEVARLDASQWAISARGFNDVFANKLLVLQDGRSIYTPLFSGVFWDVQGTMLEDIDRIEVIRGPGATLWGANAVNGVINIITRGAKDTQGLLITAGAGSEERGMAGIRYGGKIAENAFFRMYGTYFDVDDAALPNGGDANDAWQLGRWGFRVDWDLSEQNLVTLQGDAYRGAINQVFGTFVATNPPTFSRTVHDEYEVTGGNVLGRWSHTFSSESDLRLQLYYDRTERDTVIFTEKRDTFDVDFQHRFSLVPNERTLDLYSAFVQDEFTLVPERLRLTVGSKFEHNDFTGLEVQPSGRLLWTPSERQTFWGSVARAVRTPSRAEEDITLNQVQQVEVAPGISVFVPTTIHGSSQFGSEEVLAYELGYRAQPHPKVSVDVAAFYNVYDHLRSVEQTAQTQFIAGNKLFGETYGLEAAGTWEVMNWWRLKPAYTFLDMQLHKRADSTDLNSERDEGKNPAHQFTLRSSMDLPHDISLDCMVRYVDHLPALNIDSYVGLDVRLGWRPTKHLELALVGQNLLQEQHAEFRPSFIRTQQAEIERGVYVKAIFRF